MERKDEILHSWHREHWKILNPVFSLWGHEPQGWKGWLAVTGNYAALWTLLISSTGLIAHHLSPIIQLHSGILFTLLLIPALIAAPLVHPFINIPAVAFGYRGMTAPKL